MHWKRLRGKQWQCLGCQRSIEPEQDRKARLDQIAEMQCD